ncbi:MAG: hypothetical protein JSU08_12615 [Acidobacteria bacterium]|nr:hypothetical protein [Acidobacteriota bacterium]
MTVVERYLTADGSGLPIQAEHRVIAATSVAVHDEVGEVGDMAVDFLRLFSDSNVPAATAVHNFKAGCGANGTGKQDEQAQIEENRRNYTILPDWFVGPARVTVAFGGTTPFRARRGDAWAAVDVRWHSQCRVQDPSIGCPRVGSEVTTSGIDWMTATFDGTSNRWWLCDSDYQGLGGTLRGFLK